MARAYTRTLRSSPGDSGGFRTFPRFLLSVGVALTLLSFTACASAPAQNPFEGGGGGGQIRVYVQNLGLSDVVISALTAGRTRELGTVQRADTRTFRLSWNQTAPISFRLDFRADGEYSTRTVVGVSPNAMVEVNIPANGGAATVQVR